jgi:hypothetical protein
MFNDRCITNVIIFYFQRQILVKSRRSKIFNRIQACRFIKIFTAQGHGKIKNVLPAAIAGDYYQFFADVLRVPALPKIGYSRSTSQLFSTVSQDQARTSRYSDDNSANHAAKSIGSIDMAF